jgi:hypothetical protein
VVTNGITPGSLSPVEWVERRPEVDVDRAAYYRLLGYPPGVIPEGLALELADMALAWFAAHSRPWCYVRDASSLAVNGATVVLDGEAFTARRLSKMLREGALGAVIVAVSAGPELEHEAAVRWKDEKPDEYFFLETAGSAVVERLLVDVGARLCAWAEPRGAAVLPHDSPGYAGWNAAEACHLLAVARRTRSVEWPGALEALDSGALRPKKSALAVFGLTRTRDGHGARASSVPCHNCPAPVCQYRRVPYRFGSVSCS